MLADFSKLGVLLCLCTHGIEALNGTADAPAQCCGSVTGGTCADGTYGTPCCGRGGCNVFCCNCDGGCRTAPAPAPPTPEPPSAASTPLNQWPMIMSHDAATSYYASNTCTLAKAVQNYVMTQVPGTFTSQLNCGTRAFDLRPKVVDGKLVAHHGAVSIDKTISDILAEIVTWASQNPTEFVLVYGSHCDGPNCQQMFLDALNAAKIATAECGDIASLTLGSAMKNGLLPNGGSVLAVWGCVHENYDPSITCYGELEEGESRKLAESSPDHPTLKHPLTHTCYGSDSKQAFDPLWSYMTATCDGRGKKQSELWMAQAHWQNDASSITQGEVMLSCILKDESKAGVNEKLAQKIQQGSFPHINLLEVDDVCGGHGPAILNALRSRFTFDIAVKDNMLVV